VYLCGPITGTPLGEAVGWRRAVAETLAGVAQVIDPTRYSPDTTRRSDSAATRELTEERLLRGRRTVERDQADVRRSDLVLACFLGARSVSIGSVGEMFWADAMGKPIVVVREEENVHNHDMLNAIAGWIFTDLDAAIVEVKRLINSGVGR
jgi:nucleoside 2-deoxyribosyltransferase